jgi:hypothetical protein
MSILRSLLVLFLLAAPVARGQVVESPVAFDSAGRIMALTRLQAARASLQPPAWRVVGDFSEARLYSIGGGAYVLTVARRDGAIERYAMTQADVDYLRDRIETLPPPILSMPDNTVRGAFIRNQALLGLTVYAPTFAVAITDDNAGASAAYLLVAGATFFGASQLARDYTITAPQNNLATHAAVHAAAAGGALAYALGGERDAQAASAFAGGIAGSAGGIIFGRGMTEGEVAATGFGADLTALTALGLIVASTDEESTDAFDVTDDLDISREQAALLVGAAGVGYWLGHAYARRVSYNLTPGDIGTLWVSGALGALAVSPFLVESDVERSVDALAVTGGFLGGVALGERLFARRFDHSSGDATLLGLGGLAGGFVGLGAAKLFEDEGDDRNDDTDATAAAIGAVAGVGLTHWMIRPRGDQGRVSSRFRFTPAGAAFAFAGVRGTHPIVSISF